MKTTFKTPTGCSVTVEPSPTRGFVWIRWSNPEPGSAPSCIVPIPVHLAGVVAQAIEGTATAIEDMALPVETAAEAFMNDANDGGDAQVGFFRALGRL